MCKRQKISLVQIFNKFGTEEYSEQFFIENRWGKGITCPYCNTDKIHTKKTNRPYALWRCSNCKKSFSVKTHTIMHGSNLPLRTWAIALYTVLTNLKGVSSTKLASDLGITQKTAWYMLMRIREIYTNTDKLNGIIEMDEAYIGGLEKNKHENKRTKGTQGRSTKTKTAIFGMKDRITGKVKAKVMNKVNKNTILNEINTHITSNSTLIIDEAVFYKGISHKVVNHSKGQYVNDEASTNGIESFWAILKRGYIGTHHWFSKKHMDRYINEYCARHNLRKQDTIVQIGSMIQLMAGKRLTYKELIT